MDHVEDLSKTEELVMGLSNNPNVVNDASHVIKGKRTKRLRLLSTTTVIASSCSSASGGDDDQGSLSISSITTDQEEEDMANCLILLAQGGGNSSGGGGDYSDHDQQQNQQQHQKQQVYQDKNHGDGDHHKIEFKGRKLSELSTAYGAATTNKVGFYIYECKTCNRTFPSFQALGGHRASHKRPKIMAEEKKPPPQAPPAPPSPPSSRSQVMVYTNYDHHQFESGGDGGQLQPHMKRVHPINPISLQSGSAQKANNSNGNNNIKTKIHECSICGSEFTSGQALGGHMRRHRASTNSGAQAMSGTETISNATAAACATTVAFEVQPRTILELDLNLPAPEEELRDPPKFQFTATTQKSIVLSAAPALVDCHY